jgi:hypothetical protein
MPDTGLLKPCLWSRVAPAHEERRRDDFREMPCKDFDLDCLALDGRIPFGDYRRCYLYAPELGRCIFLRSEECKVQSEKGAKC